MLKKIDIRIPIIIILTVILVVLLCLYYKDDSSKYDMKNMPSFDNKQTVDTTSTSEKKNTITTTTKIQSALTENLNLHTTYYLDKLYVSENTKLSSGTKVLKYTNGKYLKAPYDCVVTSINLPNEDEKITNSHYIEVSSLNSLKMQFNISESKVSSLSIGDEAKITVQALDDKEYTGYITNISNVASNKRFTVTVEFQNDGNIMLGMTGTITI